mmetsp:Transcript_84266/g.238781  ORF Transcript_84266/g.238781 Transcript_84266/m.238781 type:complete len:105 (+) Transcript_84266:622-936(+)
MQALRALEPIRAMYPAQYEEALTDRLLLRVLTPGALARELDRYCGRGGARAGRRGEEGGGPAEGEDQLHITTDLNQLFAMPPSGYAQPDSQLTAASAARAPAEA